MATDTLELTDVESILHDVFPCMVPECEAEARWIGVCRRCGDLKGALCAEHKRAVIAELTAHQELGRLYCTRCRFAPDDWDELVRFDPL